MEPASRVSSNGASRSGAEPKGAPQNGASRNGVESNGTHETRTRQNGAAKTGAASKGSEQNDADLFVSAGDVLQHYRTLAHADILDKARRFKIADQMKELGLNPYFIPFDRNDGTEALLDGKRVLMFGSNNYLGLTHDERVTKAVKDAVDRFGTSFTGSRLLNGTSQMHLELEENLATFLGKESALVFATGYQTNLGVFSALLNRASVALIDQYAHTSIRDGCALSDGRMLTYRHNDMEHLEKLLADNQNGETGCIVATDGLYSMHGDLAPVPEMVRIVRKYGARILIDDAHGIGAIGPGGRGTSHHYGVEDDIDLIVGTFSKSLSSIGGFVAGDYDVTNFIKHFGSSMIFSASLAPANVAAANTSLKILMDEPERVHKVQRNADKWRKGLRDLGFKVDGDSPIVPVALGDDLKVFQMWRALLDNGLYVNAAVWPSVPRGGALLRTSVMATHDDDHLEEALGIFERIGQKLAVV